MYKVNGELSSCDITYSGRVPSREGDIHNFAKSLLLNGLSKSAQTFTVGFLKLLSPHPILIVVWGNFPFNKTSCKCLLTQCSVYEGKWVWKSSHLFYLHFFETLLTLSFWKLVQIFQGFIFTPYDYQRIMLIACRAMQLKFFFFLLCKNWVVY